MNEESQPLTKGAFFSFIITENFHCILVEALMDLKMIKPDSCPVKENTCAANNSPYS
jgi:hypothetical protein